MRLEKDLRPGEQLVMLLRPFREHLAAKLSPKTVHIHVGNLWALGGELIRYLRNDLLSKGVRWSRSFPG
jgi:hypothetical protein